MSNQTFTSQNLKFAGTYLWACILKQTTERLLSDPMIQHIVGKWIYNNWLNHSMIITIMKPYNYSMLYFHIGVQTISAIVFI